MCERLDHGLSFLMAEMKFVNKKGYPLVQTVAHLLIDHAIVSVVFRSVREFSMRPVMS